MFKAEDFKDKDGNAASPEAAAIIATKKVDPLIRSLNFFHKHLGKPINSLQHEAQAINEVSLDIVGTFGLNAFAKLRELQIKGEL